MLWLKNFFRVGRKMLKYLGPHAKMLPAATFMMLLVTGIHLVRPLILREIIDTTLPNQDVGQAFFLGLVFIIAVLVGAVATYGRVMILAMVGTEAMTRLKEEVFGHLLGQKMRFFDSLPPGKLISRAENDIEQMRTLFSHASAQLVASLLLLTGITGLIWNQSPELGFWLLMLVLIGSTLLFFYAGFIRRKWREIRELDSRLTGCITEFLQGVALLRLFGKEEEAVKKVSQATKVKCDLDQNVAFYDTVLFYGGFTFVTEVGVLLVLLWYGTGEVFAGRMTLGTLVMFIELMRRFFGPLRDLAEVFMHVQSGLAASTRVFDILETPVESAILASEKMVPSRFHEISFRDVSFAYSEEMVLKNVSFKVRRGEHIAIVGASGSGKSTCINMLLRFYDPVSGSIELDGIDIREFSPEKWRKKIALVLQEIHLFPGTVMENLKSFDQEIHDGRVIASAKALGAHRFIMQLAKGYNTVLAERGANLSLGERQFLCYVRAMVKNPELLVLDEATSSVDALTERHLQTAMEKLMNERTAIVIAHRLSTITSADRILVFERGKLVESGTHTELVLHRGIYRRLASLQGLDRETGRPRKKRVEYPFLEGKAA